MYRTVGFLIVAIMVCFITGACAQSYFEVKDFVIPPQFKTEGAFFEPSAVAFYKDRLIILNDEQEDGLMYLYESDLEGNIRNKYLINTDREIKDFEGITHTDEAGEFYIILSNSFGREKTMGFFKLNLTETGCNVTPVPETIPADISDKESFQRDIIYESFNRVFNGNELNIEGLGYYKGEYNEFLFLGLREPLFNNQTSVWRMNLKNLEDGKIPTPTLWFTFLADPGDKKKQAISSLEYYPEISSLFILTSYETGTDRGGSLWVAKVENPEDYNVEIPEFPLYRWNGVKPEGLTLMEDEKGKRSLFIVFDNDEGEAGIPATFTVLPLDEICPDLINGNSL